MEIDSPLFNHFHHLKERVTPYAVVGPDMRERVYLHPAATEVEILAQHKQKRKQIIKKIIIAIILISIALLFFAKFYL